MRLDITGRHVEITAQLRQLIDRRFVKLSRLLNDTAISASVILTKEKYRHVAEIVIRVITLIEFEPHDAVSVKRAPAAVTRFGTHRLLRCLHAVSLARVDSL